MDKLELRQTLVDFANEMERILQKHDYKSSWDACDLDYLQDKLIEEIMEYFVADCLSKNNDEAVLRLIDRIIVQRNQIQRVGEPKLELIDIANVCMMLWDKESKENRTCNTKKDKELMKQTYMKS
jgi:hypothetical protein